MEDAVSPDAQRTDAVVIGDYIDGLGTAQAAANAMISASPGKGTRCVPYMGTKAAPTSLPKRLSKV